MFHDEDLHANLFGVSPLTEQGLSATYTDTDLQITTSTPYGSKTILYGVKLPGDHVWRFSLPKTAQPAAFNVIRHEQHAELAVYASATFGSPTFKTLYKALSNGWLTNYPSLTAKMLSRNQPHSPATALGHITASRSGIRSTKPKPQTSRKRKRISTSGPSATSVNDHAALASTRSQSQRPSAPPISTTVALPTSSDSEDGDEDQHISTGLPANNIDELLSHYARHELPTTVLQTRILPPSNLRDTAMFSDLTGRFPATARDGSQYILLSIYKRYIHLELLASRSD